MSRFCCWGSTCLAIAICLAAALAGGTGNCRAADTPFTHPGILHSRAELGLLYLPPTAGIKQGTKPKGVRPFPSPGRHQ